MSAAPIAAAIADLRAGLGCHVVWKDADPQRHLAAAPAVGSHRIRFCMAVKADPARLARCHACCDAGAAAIRRRGAIRPRPCPFGVGGLGVPVRGDGRDRGLAWVGAWRGAVAAELPARLRRLHAQLPAPPPAAVALAAARVAGTVLAAAAAADAPAPPPADPQVAAALDWLRGRLHPAARAADAARSVGLSTSRFLHRFAAACGEGFRARRTRMLVERGLEMLADPRRTVLATALALGYGDEDAFAAACRRVHGLPPGALRRRLLRSGG